MKKALPIVLAVLIVAMLVLIPIAVAKTITITLSSQSGTVGTTVTVSNNGQNKVGNNAAVTILFDGTQVATGSATNGGIFSIPFTVPSSTPGSHSVAATTSADSGSATFTVTQISPTLSITCSPLIVDKTGSQTTTISGYLLNGASGINGKSITLSYSSNGLTFSPIETGSLATETNGYYHFAWDVPNGIPNGLYIIKANFAGDFVYVASEAKTAAPNNLLVVPEYLLGGLAALGACFVGFVAFKKRGSLPHFKRL
jgi:hypothetical protein